MYSVRVSIKVIIRLELNNYMDELSTDISVGPDINYLVNEMKL